MHALARAFAVIMYSLTVVLGVIAVALAFTIWGFPAALVMGFAAWITFVAGRVLWNMEGRHG